MGVYKPAWNIVGTVCVIMPMKVILFYVLNDGFDFNNEITKHFKHNQCMLWDHVVQLVKIWG